jgi:uncharacterized membrane protein YraQ (UPF0718 family)
MKMILKNKFLALSIIALIIISIIDIKMTYTAIDNTWNQLFTMLLIVPPIFILIGLFDVWIPRETIIKLMGEKSGVKGMALAFLLGAFSAGPTIAAFPLAMVMLKKGAKYSNVLFFLMVWSSLKLPIVFFQITTIGLKLSTIINLTMLVVFILGALISEKLLSKDELQEIETKALNYHKGN